MSDFFYQIVRTVGTPAFWISSSPVVVGIHHVWPGPFIIAANHSSPYDVAHAHPSLPAPLDFVEHHRGFSQPARGVVLRFPQRLPVGPRTRRLQGGTCDPGSPEPRAGRGDVPRRGLAPRTRFGVGISKDQTGSRPARGPRLCPHCSVRDRELRGVFAGPKLAAVTAVPGTR